MGPGELRQRQGDHRRNRDSKSFLHWKYSCVVERPVEKRSALLRNVAGEHDVSLQVVHGKGSASRDNPARSRRSPHPEITRLTRGWPSTSPKFTSDVDQRLLPRRRRQKETYSDRNQIGWQNTALSRRDLSHFRFRCRGSYRLFRRALGQDTLQCAPMHVEPA